MGVALLPVLLGWVAVAHGGEEAVLSHVHMLEEGVTDPLDAGIAPATEEAFGDPVDVQSNRMFQTGEKVAAHLLRHYADLDKLVNQGQAGGSPP